MLLHLQVPRGLEYLVQVDQLLVKQKVEVLEVITGFETKNQYKILNSLGQEVYKAKESSNCCARQICGPVRPFSMKIKDNHGNEVIRLERPLACTSCFCPCWLQSMEVMIVQLFFIRANIELNYVVFLHK